MRAQVNEDGTANWVVAGYVMVFTVFVGWIMLEVCARKALVSASEALSCALVRVGQNDMHLFSAHAQLQWPSRPLSCSKWRDCTAFLSRGFVHRYYARPRSIDI